MTREIELKARIPNPDRVNNVLQTFAEFRGDFIKTDTYMKSMNPKYPFGIRIREEQFSNAAGVSKQTVFVTWKTKTVIKGIESNNEIEFEVSSAVVFMQFLNKLGYSLPLFKLKKGKSWSYENMTIEITEVEKLGWFAELEILLPAENTNEENAVKEKLLSMLDRLEINRQAMESRSYTQMLQALN